MNFEILLSCMHQKDYSIIEKSNINSNATIINQCEKEKVEHIGIKNIWKCFFISTKERGLSKSRNMALKHSDADICLLADDDEKFNDDIEKIMLNAFENNPNYDILTFNVKNGNKKLEYYEGEIGYIRALMIASWQIAFRRKKIIEKNIFFCEKMGSGTNNGGGEENKFLYDCLKAGLKIKHLPITIASLPSIRKSMWMHGFNKEFFFNRGWATKQYLGVFGAIIYAIEYCIAKYPKYRSDISFFNALMCILKGIKQKR